MAIAQTGVRIPALLETGQPEGCPARTTIIDTAGETTTPEK
jgi:hypothetical protein